MQVFQKLKSPDYENKMIYSDWFNQKMNNEASFHRSGYVNAITPTTNRVWCTYLSFLENDYLGPFSLRIQRYQNILGECLYQLDLEELLQNEYFQHDGATAQTSLNFLREFYDERLISFRANHIYPPQSPLI